MRTRLGVLIVIIFIMGPRAGLSNIRQMHTFKLLVTAYNSPDNRYEFDTLANDNY